MSQTGNFTTTGVFPPGTVVQTLSGNAGANPVSPDASNNINVFGDGATTIVTGDGVDTLTVSVTDNFASTYTTDDANFAVPVLYNLNIFGSGGITTASAGDTVTIDTDGTIATQYDADTGSAVPAAGVLTIAGGNNIATTGAASTITIDVNGTTNHSLLLGNASGSISNLGVATNGQLPIGSTGADPVLATLTAGTGISITNAAGSITIASTGSFTWSVITADQTAVVNNGYICNKGTTLALALPATAAIGSIIRVTGINNATGWQITQAAGQQIFFGATQTTLGAGGSLTSSATRDALEIVCITANTTWQVLSVVGNITVV